MAREVEEWVGKERFFKRATYTLSQISGIPESVLLEESENGS